MSRFEAMPIYDKPLTSSDIKRMARYLRSHPRSTVIQTEYHTDDLATILALDDPWLHERSEKIINAAIDHVRGESHD